MRFSHSWNSNFFIFLLLLQVAEVKSKAEEAKGKAQAALDKATATKNKVERSNNHLRDLIKQIRDFLTRQSRRRRLSHMFGFVAKFT